MYFAFFVNNINYRKKERINLKLFFKVCCVPNPLTSEGDT